MFSELLFDLACRPAACSSPAASAVKNLTAAHKRCRSFTSNLPADSGAETLARLDRQASDRTCSVASRRFNAPPSGTRHCPTMPDLTFIPGADARNRTSNLPFRTSCISVMCLQRLQKARSRCLAASPKQADIFRIFFRRPTSPMGCDEDLVLTAFRTALNASQLGAFTATAASPVAILCMRVASCCLSSDRSIGHRLYVKELNGPVALQIGRQSPENKKIRNMCSEQRVQKNKFWSENIVHQKTLSIDHACLQTNYMICLPICISLAAHVATKPEATFSLFMNNLCSKPRIVSRPTLSVLVPQTFQKRFHLPRTP